MGKGRFSICCDTARRRRKKKGGDVPLPKLPPPPPLVVEAAAKGKKKATGARLWMRLDRFGNSEIVECDKSGIMKRVAIPARDLRILGPLFSPSASILARDKAMVVNLEFIKAIVTAEEILLVDPLRHEVLPFVDQLRQQLTSKSPTMIQGAQDNGVNTSTNGYFPEPVEGLPSELPFEFQVLEMALEVVCTFLDSNVVELETNAYPVLDELANNVSTKNLERVRSLKSNLTRLLARVQKVRDEIEHLLDDNEDMAHLYLTRKLIQNHQYEAALLAEAEATSNNTVTAPQIRRLTSTKSGSMANSNFSHENDVEDIEMMLEAYFMQLDGTRNKILSVREYIDDTEDYVNIQLDNQRNELIQLQLTLTIASFAISVETMIAGIFGMNIPCSLYHTNGFFWKFVGALTGACILLFVAIFGFARWKKLLGT